MIYYLKCILLIKILGDSIMRIKKDNIKFISISVFIVLYYFLLANWIPLTHDDWTWAGSYANTMLSENFQNLNGRYLGNIGIIIATRSLIFRVITYTVLMTSLLWIMYIIVNLCNFQNSNKNFILIFLFLGLLILPSQIHKQTISWFSGFYNYIPALIFTLIILLYSLNILLNRKKLSGLHVIIFISAAFIGQFFMENHSIFNTFILLLFTVLYYSIYKKFIRNFLLATLTSIIGFVLMFTNKNYLNILLGNSEYQQLQSDQSFLKTAIDTIIVSMPKYIFFDHVIILTIIGIMSFIVIVKKTKENDFKHLIFISFLLFSLPFYKLFVYDQFNLYKNNDNTLISIVNFIVCLIFLLTLVFVIIKFIEDINIKTILLSLLLSTITLAGPLIIVSPIGPRNFFAQHILWFLILTILILYLYQHSLKPEIIVLPTIALMVCYLFVFNTIHINNIDRIENLKSDINKNPNKDYYVVQKLPFEHFLQHSSPRNKVRDKEWLNSIGIEQEVNLKFVPHKE